MTAQKDQIQMLIAEIDRVLSKTSPRLPWVMSGDAAEQRVLLERIRNYLSSLQQYLAGNENSALSATKPNQLSYDIQPRPIQNSQVTHPAQSASIHQEAAQQILQAVMHEMDYLRVNLAQPLQTELEALRQQRESLLQEVRQLEAQRQQYAFSPQQTNQQMIAEFLQVLMERLQENLTQQIAQNLNNLGAQSFYNSTYAASPLLSGMPVAPALESEKIPPLLHPAERLEHLQTLQARSDQLLMSLDLTLSTVFEALQRNVNTYQESLAQGIDKMHNLGNQGEVMFTALVNHLAQQLGREASSYLQGSTHPDNLETIPPVSAKLTPAPPNNDVGSQFSLTRSLETNNLQANPEKQEFKLPYPGIELPQQPTEPQRGSTTGPDLERVGLQDLDLEDLDLSDLDLGEPDLTIADLPEVAQLLDLDLDTLADESSPANAGYGRSTQESQPSETTSIALEPDSPDAALFSLLEVTPDLATAAEAEPTNEIELDSALDFLDQLSAALQEIPPETPAEPSVESESSVNPPPDTNNTYEELDDFYTSLFGSENTEPEEVEPVEAATTPAAIETDDTLDSLELLNPDTQAASVETLPTPQSDLGSIADFLFADEAEVPAEELPAAIDQSSNRAEDASSLSSLESLSDFDQDRTVSEEPISIDAMALLADLLEESGPDQAQPTTESSPAPAEEASLLAEFDSDTAISAGEDSYIPAAPEESLLAADEPEASSDLDLALDADTLQQLSEDLSSLEGLENSDFRDLEESFGVREDVKPPLIVADSEQTEFAANSVQPPARLDWEDLTLDGFANTLLEPETTSAKLPPFAAQLPLTQPEPNAEPSAPTPPGGSANFTLESLDELFGDLPPLNPESSDTSQFGAIPSLPVAETYPTSDDDSSDLTLNDVFAEFTEATTTDPSSDFSFGFLSPDALNSDSESSEKKKILVEKTQETIQTKAEIKSVDLWQNHPHPPVVGREEASSKNWYLGVDFGTTGLSAVLLNRLTGKLHPIYWEEVGADGAIETLFRFPTAGYLLVDANTGELLPDVNIAVGSTASLQALSNLPPELPEVADDNLDPTAVARILLQNFKPALKIGLPHYSPQTAQWEPILQWSDQQQISLHLIQKTLQTLLSTLKPGAAPESATKYSSNSFACAAVGLDPQETGQALNQLAGVIVGYPSNWPDTYSFNMREAILGTGLVSHSEQIFFIEDAIATVLSGLRDPNEATRVQGKSVKIQAALSAGWRGDTLVISAGATTTDLVMVNLPPNIQDLSYGDFNLRSLTYAGNFLDQDIVCQLLYPQLAKRQVEIQQPENTSFLLQSTSPSPREAFRLTETKSQSERFGSSPLYGETSTAWGSLNLEGLDLPLPGEPDLQTRYRLQQRLESSPLGQQLLEAAKHIKLILQHQDRFTLELGSERWVVQRRQLESQVFLPFIQRLNRELNALLAQTGIPVLAIKQAICTGGTASIPAIARWLRQKLPNATIIQDTYPDTPPVAAACSRVAYGLAALPFYPQVIDLPRQQYGDYFLLLELLRTFPEHPISAGGIMQLLERRGINTQTCHLHILAFLEGHLPPGLIPSERDMALLSEQSRQNLDYQILAAEPLFYKDNHQTYRPNARQSDRLRRYLNRVMANTYQKLEEPFTVNLGV